MTTCLDLPSRLAAARLAAASRSRRLDIEAQQAYGERRYDDGNALHAEHLRWEKAACRLSGAAHRLRKTGRVNP